MASSRPQLLYLDLLRLLATLAVVFLHTSAVGWGRPTEISPFSWEMLNVYDSCVRWCIPIFVMISGFLFLDREPDLKRLAVKIAHLLLLVCIWRLFMLREVGTWFLKMLILMYAFVPLGRFIVLRPKLETAFVILGAVVALCMPFIRGITSTDWQSYPLYAFFFVAGHWLGTRELSPRLRRILYVLGFAGLLVTIAGTSLLTALRGTLTEWLYDYYTLNVTLTACALFVFFRYAFEDMRLSETASQCLRRMAGCSLGVYLLHGAILFGRGPLFFSPNHPLLAPPLEAVGLFLLCLTLCLALDRVPFVRGLLFLNIKKTPEMFR